MPTRETLIDVLPFLILWSLCAGIGIAIGKRKGVGVPFAILGSFPLWVALFAFWLVKQPDVGGDDGSPPPK